MASEPRFRSKVDWWIGPVLAVPPIAAVWGEGLIGLTICALLYGGLLFPLYYQLAPDALVIRFGLARIRVPYERIRRVVPTRNAMSSPALSLERLHVDAGKPSGPNISPTDKAGFLRALAERTPHLELRSDRLVPRA